MTLRDPLYSICSALGLDIALIGVDGGQVVIPEDPARKDRQILVAALKVAEAALDADQARRDYEGVLVLEKCHQVGPAAVRDVAIASGNAALKLEGAIHVYRALTAPPAEKPDGANEALETATLEPGAPTLPAGTTIADVDPEALTAGGSGTLTEVVTDKATIEESLKDTTAAAGPDAGVQTSAQTDATNPPAAPAEV